MGYEASRKATHEDLRTELKACEPSIDGVEYLIECVKEALQQEKPVREAETFDMVLYDKTVWRQRGESMATYIIRRRREFDKLKELSDKTAISEDIKCHLLLRFSGLSNFQRPQVIASCGNKFELTSMEAAMRTQFPTAVSSDDRGGRGDRQDHRQDRGRDKERDSGK